MNFEDQQTPETSGLEQVLELIHDSETSPTLTTGNECLNQFFGDAEAAISQYPAHAIEISLSSICKKMDEMLLTAEVEGLFNHVLNLIQAHDDLILS